MDQPDWKVPPRPGHRPSLTEPETLRGGQERRPTSVRGAAARALLQVPRRLPHSLGGAGRARPGRRPQVRRGRSSPVPRAAAGAGAGDSVAANRLVGGRGGVPALRRPGAAPGGPDGVGRARVGHAELRRRPGHRLRVLPLSLLQVRRRRQLGDPLRAKYSLNEPLPLKIQYPPIKEGRYSERICLRIEHFYSSRVLTEYLPYTPLQCKFSNIAEKTSVHEIDAQLPPLWSSRILYMLQYILYHIKLVGERLISSEPEVGCDRNHLKFIGLLEMGNSRHSSHLFPQNCWNR